MRGQFRLQHLFKCVGKQAGEDAVFAKEIVDAAGTGQLLLDALNRGHDRRGSLLVVNHGVTPFLFVRRGSIAQTS